MRIRKWDGSAWTAISPKVTYTDVVADVTAASPTSIFSGGKLLAAYLPDFVFGGMRFADDLGTFSDSAFASKLDAVYLSYGQDDIDGMIGKYFIANSTQTIVPNSSTQAGSTGRYYTWDAGREFEEDSPDGNDIVVEHGDWVVIIGVTKNTGQPYQVQLSVVNNTYQTATASARGIIKIEDNTTQTVAANSVSATAGRTYGVQLNSSGQAVVNVPWTDTNTDTNTTYTTSAVDSGANAIIRLTGSDSSTEDITLVAGSNMTITPSGDNITLASAHPNISAASSVNNSGRTYIQDITVDSNGHITGITSATETVTNTDTNTVTSIRRDNTGTYRTGNINLVGGSNVTITETSAGVFSFASTDTNTNTTYSAGSGIALSGTTFSVAGGVGLTQEASGLKSEFPIAVSTSAPDSAYQIQPTATAGALWFDLS